MSPNIKAAGDSIAVPTAVLAWMKAITIPEIAALLAGIYTALRIGELLYSWYRKWRSK